MVAASFYPRRISQYVPSMQYAAEVNLGDPYILELGAPLALDADGILAAGVMVNGSAVTFNTFTSGLGTATLIGSYGKVPVTSLTAWPDKWGRNVTVVASAANARTLTVTGYDYLGQKMIEVLTINGTTTVQGLKAFAWIESLVASSDTDTTTINVGWGNKFGLPFKSQMMTFEIKNGVIAANAGTFVGAVTTDPQTSTTGDPRGTYLPVTVLPDGTNTFKLGLILERSNLHGVRHYSG